MQSVRARVRTLCQLCGGFGTLKALELSSAELEQRVLARCERDTLASKRVRCQQEDDRQSSS